MKHRLLNMLVCPECQAALKLESMEEEAGQIRTGFLKCSENGCEYPITNFVPRFVDSDKERTNVSVSRPAVPLPMAIASIWYFVHKAVRAASASCFFRSEWVGKMVLKC